MKILKSKAFWITIGGLSVLALIILWVRQHKCSTGVYPWEPSLLTGVSNRKCSFWTANPIDATKRQASSGCCKDAQGNDCSPCLSMPCCEAGFKAGYVENRDVIRKQDK